MYAAAAERGIPPRKGQPVTLGREIGTEDLINLMERFGFRGPFLEGDDFFRGGVSATPLEVAAAAATLTAAGQKPRTYFLRQLLNSDGNQILSIGPSTKSAFASTSVRTALETQFSVDEPRILLGSSPSKTDAWAVWLGSERTICLWVGHDTPTRLDSPGILFPALQKSIQRLGAARPKLVSASQAKR